MSPGLVNFVCRDSGQSTQKIQIATEGQEMHAPNTNVQIISNKEEVTVQHNGVHR